MDTLGNSTLVEKDENKLNTTEKPVLSEHRGKNQLLFPVIKKDPLDIKVQKFLNWSLSKMVTSLMEMKIFLNQHCQNYQC